MAQPAIRRLLAGGDASAFRCGDAEYDVFLQRYAGQNQERLFVGTTYAALDGPRMVGYVTVAVGQMLGRRERGPSGIGPSPSSRT